MVEITNETSTTPLSLPELHGPEESGYDNIGYIAYGKPCPWIRCLCGWESSNGNHSWQDAGEDFDRHLEEVPQL